MANLERDCMTAVLKTKNTEAPADCSRVEPKQLLKNKLNDPQRLLITNVLRKPGLEKDKLGQGNATLLSSLSLPDPRLTDVQIAEYILFSNKLAETGEVRLSDPTLTNDSTIQGLKLLESTNPDGKIAYMDAQIKDTDTCHLVEPARPHPEPLMDTDASSRGHCFCLQSAEEFGFLLMPDFLILSVSFLFLAYGCGAPGVHLVPYALSVGVEHKHAAFLMSIFGVSSIVGNITFGWIMDRK